MLHGQAFTIHRAVPRDVKLSGRTRIVGINDKGAALGAFIGRRDVVEEATGEAVCTLEQTTCAATAAERADRSAVTSAAPS